MGSCKFLAERDEMERPMISVEDFTSLPEGFSVALEGRVGVCPRCGRNGVEEHRQDGTYFVHVQTSEIFGDGMLTEPRDCCPLPPVH